MQGIFTHFADELSDTVEAQSRTRDEELFYSDANKGRLVRPSETR